MSAVCVFTQALLKINKSVCHLCAPLDQHTTVHLGPERKYQELKHKIQIQKPCVWQLPREDRNTVNFQTKKDKYPAVVCCCSTSQNVFSLLKCWRGSCNRYSQPTVHTATQDSLFGQFPGNSVISARPEMNEGRVDSGWDGGEFLGGRGWRVGDLSEKSFGWWPPAEAVWQTISLIPLQSKAPFLWPVNPDVLENWRKKCSYKNSLWSCWWELGKAHNTHSWTHTITSQNDIPYRLYCSHLAFQ